MPERQRGRDPNRHQQPPELPGYYKAARYPDEPTSNTAYEEARQAIADIECDLSVYRTLLLPDQLWHLLVIGETPVEELRSRIDQALLRGVAVELPKEVWTAFNLRRLEQRQQGTWVERRVSGRRLRN
jgi:hypothetical protein